MKAELFKLDTAIFRTVLEAFIQQEMTRAVREFLRAALARIPVRTGFMRGSFTELVDFFKAGVNTTSGGNFREFYYPDRILKSPRAGVKFVTPPQQVLRRVGNQVIFTLDNKIRYYQINDLGNKIPSAPWESSKEGLAAMANWLEGAANRFPDISEIVTRIFITASSSGISYSERNPDITALLATRELNIRGFS